MIDPTTADGWLTLVSHWPDCISLIVGSLVGFVLSSMLDLYFLPVPANDAQTRRQKGGLFLFCWGISTLASIAMWYFLDGKDSWSMRIVVSLIVSAPAYALYPMFARVAAGLLKKFFNIDLSSAWSKQ